VIDVYAFLFYILYSL